MKRSRSQRTSTSPEPEPGACTAHWTPNLWFRSNPLIGPVPECQHGTTYGVWSTDAVGYVYTDACATRAANWLAEELTVLGRASAAARHHVLPRCPQHGDEYLHGCEQCL